MRTRLIILSPHLALTDCWTSFPNRDRFATRWTMILPLLGERDGVRASVNEIGAHPATARKTGRQRNQAAIRVAVGR
jgi:hypothetical protein